MLTDLTCRSTTWPPERSHDRFHDGQGLHLEVAKAGANLDRSAGSSAVRHPVDVKYNEDHPDMSLEGFTPKRQLAIAASLFYFWLE